MNNVRFDASDFLNRIGVEDKLNAFLDSEPVKGVILAEYEAVKADVMAALGRLPEKYRVKATEAVDDTLKKMDEEVFVESVLGKMSEEVAFGLATLENYLDITAVTQQLLDAVEEKDGLQNTLQEMAHELAYALKRRMKTAMVKVVSDNVEDENEFKQMLEFIFEGDEDAPTVITVEGAENVFEALGATVTYISANKSVADGLHFRRL